MAITPNLVFASLMSNRNSSVHPLGGDAYQRLAQGVANGVTAWAIGQPQNVALSGTSVGSAGAGVIVPAGSRVVIPPNVGVMQGALSGAGLNGQLAASLASVMALGVSEAFSLHAQYSGTSAGVAVGQDTSKVTQANPQTLIALLQQTLPGAGVGGVLMPMVATGLGNGIAALLLLGTGTAAVTGAPVIPVVSGVGLTASVLM